MAIPTTENAKSKESKVSKERSENGRQRHKIDDFDSARLRLVAMRDELKLKIHLARADARDEWRKLEKDWRQLESRLSVARSESGEVASQAWTDVKKLASDLKQGYERVRTAV